MSANSDSPLSTAGSSSHARFPFAPGGVATDRQATVLSAPRGDGGSSISLGPATGDEASPPAAPTATSIKLFPSQRMELSEDAAAGQTLGHFTIRRRIGSGGMGTVFLADDEKLQRQVALKVLSPEQTADPASVQRFINEARAAARLDHDHVARVFFYGDDQGLHYIAYEYVQGGNLRELIRARGRLEPAEVVAYAVQLAAALCHTSACGVVHRDIKPSNIIVTQQGKAKLVDLGLARKESLEESAQLTVAGTTLGTFDYISPEQAKDPRNVDVRSDIYSLGCTLYHALTGEAPYPDGTVLQRLLDHQEKEPPDPAVKNRRVSPALSAVVRKMMAADQRRRYPSAEALLHDLLLIASAMGLRTLPDGQSALASLLNAPRGSWWTQNASWVVTAMALVLVAGVWQAFPQWISPSASGSLAPSSGSGSPTAQSELSPPNDGSVASRFLPSPTLTTTDMPTASSSSRLPGVANPNQGTRAPLSGNPADPASTTSDGTTIHPMPLAINAETPQQFTLDGGRADLRMPPVVPGDGRTPAAPTSGAAVANAATPGSLVPPSTASAIPSALVPESGRSESGGTPPGLKTGATIVGAEAVAAIPANLGGAAPGTTQLPVVVGPFVVVGNPQSYPTLEAACAEVRDGGVIELHFDGRRPEAERPLRLVSKRITIQAARGHRPVLWFAPKEGVADPLQSRMITVSGSTGSLSIANVALELQLKPLPGVDLWSLFRLERPERLRLENTHVTVSNPSHAAATVIECASPPPAFVKMGAMKDGQPVVATEILVERSVIRGEATGIRVRDAAPLNCDFRQSFFALGEWLLNSELAPDVMSPMMDISLSLTDNTCLLGQGLLRSVNEDDISGRQAKMKVSARSSLFSCAPGVGLIEQQFAQQTADFRQSLQWSGDRNHFDNVETMWLVRFNAPPSEDRWDFDVWRSFWNTGEAGSRHNQPIGWMSETRGQAWSKISPQGIWLNLQQQAVDAGAQQDQPKSGVSWDLLPAEPSPSASRNPASP
ncbi:MAG: protein kinase [Planctomycetaceae bacterium]|nr:protein kinase [Planctomycetaceae bacterium]